METDLTGEPTNQRPEPIDLEAFFADPQFANPSISPDGTRIAYLAPQRGRRNVWVRGIDATHDDAEASDRWRTASEFTVTSALSASTACSKSTNASAEPSAGGRQALRSGSGRLACPRDLRTGRVQ
ncbi:hypothetical protein [Nocardia sp. NPDC002869]|uniref:hypothetical protein n=1 Tax=Nocardia sp. NPDC002869 TaxID=3161032 RepID=UPI00398D61E4